MGLHEGDQRERPPTEGSAGSPPRGTTDRAHRGSVSGTSYIGVRRGTPADAATAALLHESQITEGFLSHLGRRFLERLYRRIALSESSFLLVAEERQPDNSDNPADSGNAGNAGDSGDSGNQNHPGGRKGAAAGFLAGSTDVRALYSSFALRDLVPAAAAAGPRLARSWRRALETLGHPRRRGPGAARKAELLAVAVEPSFRGRGVGTLLVRSFLEEISDHGASSAHVVLGADNAAARALYERSGFVEAGRFEMHAGTESLLMRWDRVALDRQP
jgi:ribosomal protein S18 acetylase RimI-like enzyme